MKTLNAIFFAILILISASAFSEQYPKPVGFINDFAKVLDADDRDSLNIELNNFEFRTKIEVVVVTVKSLNGQSVDDYTLGLAKEWGVGKKDLANGVVFLIAPTEHKMRIEVGTGLQSILTDAQAKNILDSVVKPYFKNENYRDGIVFGMRAIMVQIDFAKTTEASVPQLEQAVPTAVDLK